MRSGNTTTPKKSAAITTLEQDRAAIETEIKSLQGKPDRGFGGWKGGAIEGLNPMNTFKADGQPPQQRLMQALMGTAIMMAIMAIAMPTFMAASNTFFDAGWDIGATMTSAFTGMAGVLTFGGVVAATIAIPAITKAAIDGELKNHSKELTHQKDLLVAKDKAIDTQKIIENPRILEIEKGLALMKSFKGLVDRATFDHPNFGKRTELLKSEAGKMAQGGAVQKVISDIVASADALIQLQDKRKPLSVLKDSTSIGALLKNTLGITGNDRNLAADVTPTGMLDNIVFAKDGVAFICTESGVEGSSTEPLTDAKNATWTKCTIDKSTGAVALDGQVVAKPLGTPPIEASDTVTMDEFVTTCSTEYKKADQEVIDQKSVVVELTSNITNTISEAAKTCAKSGHQEALNTAINEVSEALGAVSVSEVSAKNKAATQAISADLEALRKEGNSLS